MEAKLLDRIRHKLDQLELGMQTHRCQLLAEFHNFCRQLLQGVPPDKTSSVQDAVAAIVGNYPLLRPNTRGPPMYCLEPNNAAPSPLPPISPPAASEAIPGPSMAGSHQDASELEGLFTPTYLPLLETHPMLPASPPVNTSPGTDPANTTSVTAPSIAQPPLAPPDQDIQTMRQEALASTAATQDTATPVTPPVSSSRLLTPSPPHFPVPLLLQQNSRSVDDARSSVSSDKSDSKTPRSAMRRSSSTNKASSHSPRRVRFEFMGAEVLPTSSPQSPEFAGPRPSSPGPWRADDDDDHSHDDDDEYAAFASDLGGDSTGGDKVPPRKVSSSDALRALSRAPLEEGAPWTVVNDDTDHACLDELDAVPIVPAAIPPANTIFVESQDPGQRGLSCMNNIDKTHTTDDIEEIQDDQDDHGILNADDQDDSSDDGFLAMASTKSTKQKVAQTVAQAVLPVQSPTKPSNKIEKSSRERTCSPMQKPRLARLVNSRQPIQAVAKANTNDEDDGELFHFESEASTTSQARPRKTRPSWQSDSESDDQDGEKQESEQEEVEQARDGHAPNSLSSIYATSPAIPIRQPGDSQPLSSSNTKFQPGSLGSYKGRPLMMPIVRDPELLAQAVASKPPGGSLGSVDEQAVLEEGSLPRFPSTPRSFKERFLREQMADGESPDEDSTKEIRW